MATPTLASAPRHLARKLLRYVIGSLTVLIVLFGGFTGWFVLAGRGSLPTLDGKLMVTGLHAPVTVLRDPQGVPHITAASLEDLFFAQGYVTAQDRLWQMDMTRRYASGRLAEILGASYAKSDIQQRTLLMPMVAERAAAALSQRDRAYLEAYAHGVNAYIADNANHLPPEFRVLHYSPQPWTVVDSLFVGAGMAEMLNLGSLEQVLDRERIAAKLGPELASDLYPNSSFRDYPPVPGREEEAIEPVVAGNEQDSVKQPDAQESKRRTRRGARRPARSIAPPARRAHSRRRAGLQFSAAPFGFDAGPLFPGSNNWVVSGAHTASGKPILSNDMHLPHQIPNTWYEVHLTSGNFDVAGVSLPGLPFVIVGHNQRIAWGFTNIGPSVTDLYNETFNDKGQYLTPEGWKDPEHRAELVRVRGGRDIKVDVAITRHGPIVSALAPSEKRMLALKWVIHDPAALGEPFFDVNSAQNWDEFLRAFSHFGGPAQNVVYADVDGHIGYHATGLVPIRPATWAPEAQPGTQSSQDPGVRTVEQASPSAAAPQPDIISGILNQAHSNLVGLPVPGSDNAHEWLGYIPFEKLPGVFDPPSGIIATANGRITPDGYPYMISNQWGAPYRTQRIYRLLGADKKFAPADMLAVQTDIYSDFDRFCAQRFVYALDHAANATARAKQAAELLRGWDGRVTTDSAPATIVSASRRRLTALLLEPRLGKDYDDYRWFMSSVWLENVLLLQPPRWLPSQYASYDDLLATALEDAVSHDAPR
ncbi:MAG TPA: penicillin acylase family protein, partial [Terriglobales bacterium]|nr:penicillin acylase family protein [Terriglobales bacterium]